VLFHESICISLTSPKLLTSLVMNPGGCIGAFRGTEICDHIYNLPSRQLSFPRFLDKFCGT